jgi:catechol 2,3-dioxygenase-like lactoylglutathione lyase family enzyme
LERFLAARGAGPHHLNFLVTDFDATLARIRAFGIEPVGVNVANPNWREAFLHPRSAHRIVIQVAQQLGSPPTAPPPRELAEPGPPARFDLIEHHVSDLDRAVRFFREVLGDQVNAASAGAAEVT